MSRTVIQQADFKDLTVILGALGYIEQGNNVIVVEREHALALSDKLATWAARAAPPTLSSPDR